ncbi:YlbL family protein [Leifsonia sp. Leaf264]|uniref:YlbL family protein n=1 Tax=Leifsonia sp. Leaf264 TaxID=1736314 RepID=UPI0006FB0037|nr:PDZ domain-containing protein [Leifsonia sp. Leaf264]KQP01543.1 ATP-dependent serine peptidase containing a PDZ domain protein [Leifsonia sp. Leaf264]
MSLFTDAAADDGARPPRRARPGWILLGIALVAVIVLGLMPAPYVIDLPGPVYNTLGTAEHDGKQVPLISIPDEKIYDTKGSLNLLTVSQKGNREQQPGWFEVATSWFDPTRAVLPIDSVFPEDVSDEQIQKQSQAMMVDSQQDAIAAALVELGYDFPREVTVAGLTEGSPADGVLEEGDVITALNGTAVHDTQALRDAVAENGTDKPATVDYERDGTAATAQITPIDSGGTPLLGVGVRMNYEFPFQVDIQLDNVGGPSAGQMFALGIIDKLTPGLLNGGEDVAGTGTIDSAGNIGAIGGIRQKLYGAKDAGADWFLAPASNCNEVVGHVPDGLTVFSVTTLDDSMKVLDAIANGDDTSGLPSCAAAS